MTIKIGILKETANNETRVAVVPEIAKKLAASGAEFLIEKNAGRSAGYNDNNYPEVCAFKESMHDVLSGCNILLTVNPPNDKDITSLKENTIVIGFMNPFDNESLIKQMAKQNLVSFSVELIPRISRAQSMDALSSQASIAGYKAVVLAANHSNKFFPMLTTAAGTVRPSQVLVIGAGVAGLQAIATAKRLGSRVLAFDVRSSTKEQIESLGATFLDTGVSAEGDGGYARELTKEELKKIYNNVYILTLVALFFSLFGTILGRIWADQSWGRFWGWDPKENGALLIVMWHLMVLHLRVSGMAKPLLFCFSASLVNIIVMLAWFGVNLLNVGLHSYGFTDNVATNLFIFIGFEIILCTGLYLYGKNSHKEKILD